MDPRNGMATLSLLVDNAIREGLITGFAMARGDAEGEKDSFFSGKTSSGRECGKDTIFDIASLTKVVGTTNILALLMERGLLSPESKVKDFLPHYRCGELTIRQLATHYSGLPHLPLASGEEMENLLAEVSPQTTPGSSYLYSCINFHILCRIAKKITGEKPEDFAEENIFVPLGMKDTSWGTPKDLARTAESINAPPGIISDEWARSFLPARTGNAGIFSSLGDLEKMAEMLLKRGKGFFTTDIVERELFRFSSPPGKDLRTFGYNGARDGLPENFSPQSVFHTGWTGQSFFLDPVKNIYCIVLTIRKGDKIRCAAFRRKAAELFCNNL